LPNQISFPPYEAAKATDILEFANRESIRSGELLAVRIGRKLVIRRESLDQWLQSHERKLTEAGV